MSLFDIFGKMISDEAKRRARIPIPKDNDRTGVSGTTAVAQDHYIQLILADLFLEKNNEWFTTRHPLVYSLIALQYGDHPKVEFPNVSGKNKFDIKQADLNRSILRNYALTPLIPFRGGSIELDMGLVSMPANDMLQSFAKTVSDVAGVLNVPQVSAVANIASTVASSVQALLGVSGGSTKLTAHDLFSGGTVTSGYTLLSSLAESEFRGKTVWMTNDGPRVGKDKDNLEEIKAQDFMVLLVRCTTQRDDWQSLSAIGVPLDSAIEAKLAKKDDEAQVLLLQAINAARKSPDLTRKDASRVAKAIKAYYDDETAITATVRASETAAGGREEGVQESADDEAGPKSLHLEAAMNLLADAEADAGE